MSRRGATLASWVGSRRRLLATAAAVLLLELVGFGAWRVFDQWRLGRIVLTNDGPPLTVRVLDESGEHPIGDPVDVVRRATLALPAGDYRLRVEGSGLLGRTHRMAVGRGETVAYELSLDDGRLLGRERGLARWSGEGDPPRDEPIPFARLTRALELTPGRSDLVEFDGRTIVRRDAVTGRPVWDATDPGTCRAPGRDPTDWVRRIGRDRPGLAFVEPAPDLDGDGTRDVILVVGRSNAFLALSGRDGSMLWNHVAAMEGPGGPQPEGPEIPGPIRAPGFRGRVLDPPAIGDVDGDGAPDLIATIVFRATSAEADPPASGPGPRPGTAVDGKPRRRVIAAISGRTGRTLWNRSIDPRFQPMTRRDDPAVLLRGRRGALVAFVDDAQWLALDPASGRPLRDPIELGFAPGRPLQYPDIDGDGDPEILAIGPGVAALTLFSVDDGAKRWTSNIAARFVSRDHPKWIWPWLVDLDGDGPPEIVVPESGLLLPSSRFAGICVLDGRSGQPRWTRRMQPGDGSRIAPSMAMGAPDLDGDGTRELIVFSTFPGRESSAMRLPTSSRSISMYVEALSGRDGRPLWYWKADLPRGQFASLFIHLWPPRWWGCGPDGWPMLAVPVGGRDDEGGPDWPNLRFLPPTVYVLESSTGRLLHEARGLARAEVHDLDGDGLPDLWGEADGQLRAFRGQAPEAWRTLGVFAPARASSRPGEDLERPAADLDGDGIADAWNALLYTGGDMTGELTGSRTAIARSGRDGRELWRTVLDSSWNPFAAEPWRSYDLAAYPAPAGDLDGDGTPEVIVRKTTQDRADLDGRPATLPIQALSGRDGRPLWKAAPLSMGFDARGYSQIVWMEPRIIEAGAPPDLVVFHRLPSGTAGSRRWQSWVAPERLARVSGRTGRIVWDFAFEERPLLDPNGGPMPYRFVDVDGDGNLELALIVRRMPAKDALDEAQVQVVSLHAGKPLWSRPVQARPQRPQLELARRGGDGRVLVIVAELTSAGAEDTMVLTARDGRDGSVVWTWRGARGRGDRRIHVRSWFDDWIAPMALDGPSKDAICVTVEDLRGECRIVVLDHRGHERVRRVFPPEPRYGEVPPLRDWMMDLDGDGRDEVLLWRNDRLHALAADLKDLWSAPAKSWPIVRHRPRSPGTPGALILAPARAVDGASGRVLALDQGARTDAQLLDPGDASRPPLFVEAAPPSLIAMSAFSSTACRRALAATPGGDYAPLSGARVPPGLARDDPRWTRPLPWVEPVLFTIGFRRILEALGQAMVNVVLPIALIVLAARRRPWTLRLLMVLPVAAAIPLTVFQTVGPWVTAPVGSQPVSPRTLFVLGTIAGLPIVALVLIVGRCLVRRRGRVLAGLTGLIAAASAIVAAGWLRFDGRTMPAIEHYGAAGWYLVVVPGTYAFGVLVLVGWMLRASYRGLRSWKRRRPVRPVDAVPVRPTI